MGIISVRLIHLAVGPLCLFLWASSSLLAGGCGDDDDAGPATIKVGADSGIGDATVKVPGDATIVGPRADSSVNFADARIKLPALQDAGEPPTTVPDGWKCQQAFALDLVCDCGCGANDGICQQLNCTTPGCRLPACEACYDATGAPIDCNAPGEWLCEETMKADGVCDCGCGGYDPDCESGGCYELGCNTKGCERCFDGAKGWTDCSTPAPWLCSQESQSDGVCDCGCGNFDPDCTGPACDAASCKADGCDVCHGADGSVESCTPDKTYACAENTRTDGVCDCGCGVADPDCGANGCSESGCSEAACEVCHDAFGRTVPCVATWTCDTLLFGNGDLCDCGCGSDDPDCGGNGCTEANCEAASCDIIHSETGAPKQPTSWTCDPAQFNDGLDCDCGCGALDPDCENGCTGPGCTAPSCDRCRLTSGEYFSCNYICGEVRWNDTTCDCGCGSTDPGCASNKGCSGAGCFEASCQRCVDGAGDDFPCARGACPSAVFNDGICDCGCREADPDCAGQLDCLEPGCSTASCARCHDSSGNPTQCDSWMCSLEKQSDGNSCNCGCGAVDGDCIDTTTEANNGCTTAGCFANACDSCRSTDGAAMSCSQ